jgi:hypothetical protein
MLTPGRELNAEGSEDAGNFDDSCFSSFTPRKKKNKNQRHEWRQLLRAASEADMVTFSSGYTWLYAENRNSTYAKTTVKR